MEVKEKIKYKFEISDYDLLHSNDSHTIVRAKVVNVGKNFNQTSFTKENIKKAIPSIYNIPLLGIYNEIEEDFKSHASNEREKAQTYAVGVVPESCDAHFEKIEGMEYLIVDMVVWKNYFPQFFSVMAKNDEEHKQTTISMEISLIDYENVDGVFNITDFVFEGIFLLGENVNPGIPNAGLRVIKFEEGKIDLEDNSLYESLLQESNKELEMLEKFSEKTLSTDNDEINNINLMKGEVGNMAKIKKVFEDESLAENLDEVITKNIEGTEAEPTPEAPVEEVTEVAEETEAEGEASTEVVEEADKVETEEGQFAEEEEIETPAIAPEAEETEVVEEEAPITKSERKTYEANEKSFKDKIKYLKEQVEMFTEYKEKYEAAEILIKELEDYKEEAELNKLATEKNEYVKAFNMSDFDEEDADEIKAKINDYSFSFAEFKGFMADMVKKYGMKSRFSNISDIINMFDTSSIAGKYSADADLEVSDETNLLNRFSNI